MAEIEPDTVNLLNNVDMAPLTGNSSENAIWTILCKHVNFDSVFLKGIYYWTKKPDDQDEFPRPFTEEACESLSNGYELNSKGIHLEFTDLYAMRPPRPSFWTQNTIVGTTVAVNVWSKLYVKALFVFLVETSKLSKPI